MYAFGILVGKLVDAKGPRPNVVVGALAIGIGYYALYQGALMAFFATRLMIKSIYQWPGINGNCRATILLDTHGLWKLFGILSCSKVRYVFPMRWIGLIR